MSDANNIMVVKLGSSSVTKIAGPDYALLTSALREVIDVQQLGWNIVLVSSGAVSSGTAYLAQFGHSASRRLAAAVGQPLLMNMYSSPVADRSHTLCQILISQEDLRSASQMRVVADVLQECFNKGIIPIVNGNDVIDPDGSDNDSVATGIAVSVGADKMLLLTDVEGVYSGTPGNSEVYSTLEISDLHQIPVARSGTGRGGMKSKLRAAELASHNGVETVIASAQREAIIAACIKGEAVGTRVPSTSVARPPDKRWVAGIARSHGRLVINREAEESIRRGSSLFASGIKRVQGNFVAGDVIEISTPNGRLIARGGTNVSSMLMSLVRAMQSNEIGQVMAEIIYRFASQDPSPSDETVIPGAESLRFPVQAALHAIRDSSFPVKRKLAVELLELFPQTAVSCMTDVSRRNGRTRLAQFYDKLSSDLSFIDRDRLVVF
jgi:glutamate 5-kinase